MNLDLPEGAHVQIIIAPAATGGLLPATFPAPPPPVLPRPRHRILKGAAVLALLGVAYLVGQHANPHGRPVPVAQAQTSTAPTRALASAPAQTAEIPPAFRRQLQTPPQLTPAPGTAAPSAKAGEDGFGLEN